MIACPLCGHGRAALLFRKLGEPYRRCRSCGLVRRDPGPGELRGEAPAYHDYFPELTRSLPALTRRRYEDLLRGLERYRRGGRFLDVGCGGGFLVETARDLGWRAEGLEVSLAAAVFGRARGTTIHVGTLEDAGLPEAAFDLVTMMEVVEHVPDPVRLLRATGALLRPGGALSLTTPNWGSLSRRILGKRWNPISHDHLVYLDPRTVRAALARAGLRPVRVTTANVAPHEIAARLRPPGASGSAPRCMERTMEARETIEASATLRAGKRAANALLAATGTGDTLRVLAERPS